MRAKRVNSFLVSAVSLVLVCSCSPNQRIVESNAEISGGQANVNTIPVKSSFQQDIESMKTADFEFIYVFRRKDSQPLDADDRRFASDTIPTEMNRRTVSDEGRAIIIGSNFRMPPENMKLLTDRFSFEDHSGRSPSTGEPRPAPSL